MRASSASILRYALQAILNFVLYSLLLSSIEGALSLASVVGVSAIVAILFLLASVILESVILSFANTILLVLALPLRSSLYGLESLLILAVPLAASIIVFRLFSSSDKVVEMLRTRQLTFRGAVDREAVLRNYALFFATLSLLLPLSMYIYSYLLWSALSVDPRIAYSLMTLCLPLNVLVSLAILTRYKDLLVVLEMSFLSSMSAWSLVPLVAHLVNSMATAPRVVSLVDHARQRELSGGILLGAVKAKLEYGAPSRIYSEIDQEWIKSKRRTWFWMEQRGLLLIDPSEIQNRHIVIMGSSGSGKSLLAKNIVLEYYSKYGAKFIIFDPHNEYYVLEKHVGELEIVDASSFSLNPLDLGRLSPRERAHQLSNTIMSLFRLGHLQRQAVEELILETYERFEILPGAPSTWNKRAPTLREVLEVCRELAPENELYGRVYPYLRVLADSVFAGTTLPLNRVLARPSIITLNNLKSDYVRTLYVDTFLHKLLDAMYRRELQGDYLIVLDEAYAIFARDHSRHVASRLVMESRKYGIGMIFITQHPLSLPRPVVENAAIKIAFNITEPKNLDYVTRIFSSIYQVEKMNAVRAALRNLKSLNYLLTISGVNDVLIVSEENVVERLLEK